MNTPKKPEVPISIVIRCSDDFNLFKCLNSIDENVEIIVSLTKNKEIQKRLVNLSITSNLGFKNAKYNKVVITDSDTIFEEGCIKEFNNALDKFDIVRSKIIFQWEPKKILSKIIAEAREYIYEKKLSFTPGLGVKKNLPNKIKGFLFNPLVPWAVDADLNFRVKKEVIPFKILKKGFIYHIPIKLSHDLKAAYRIGMGVNVSLEKLSKLYPEAKDIKNNLKAVNKGEYLNVWRNKSFIVFIYQIIWDLFFHIGFYIQKYFNIYYV